jgi:hypothetical protein
MSQSLCVVLDARNSWRVLKEYLSGAAVVIAVGGGCGFERLVVCVPRGLCCCMGPRALAKNLGQHASGGGGRNSNSDNDVSCYHGTGLVSHA